MGRKTHFSYYRKSFAVKCYSHIGFTCKIKGLQIRFKSTLMFYVSELISESVLEFYGGFTWKYSAGMIISAI